MTNTTHPHTENSADSIYNAPADEMEAQALKYEEEAALHQDMSNKLTELARLLKAAAMGKRIKAYLPTLKDAVAQIEANLQDVEVDQESETSN